MGGINRLEPEYLKRVAGSFEGIGQGSLLAQQLKLQQQEQQRDFMQRAVLGGAQFKELPTTQAAGPPTAQGKMPMALGTIPEGAILGDTQLGKDLGIPKNMYMELPTDFTSTGKTGVRNWDRADLLTYYKAISSNPIMLLSERGQSLMRQLETQLKTQFGLSDEEIKSYKGKKPTEKDKKSFSKRLSSAFKMLRGDQPEQQQTLTDFINNTDDDVLLNMFE